ncbi:MAG: non-canonical purine NTP pyrophosphatase, partial [Candidatus Paceibacterota bacterium]
MTLTNVILSTRNQSKANQIRPIFQDLPVNLLTLEEAGIKGEAVENGKTLEENALKKAFFAWELTGSWSMADDTGILIDALDGRPGVNSARWAGESTTTEEIMRYTLKQLEGVPLEKRTATFKTVAAVISPEGDHLFFIGRV